MALSRDERIASCQRCRGIPLSSRIRPCVWSSLEQGPDESRLAACRRLAPRESEPNHPVWVGEEGGATPGRGSCAGLGRGAARRERAAPEREPRVGPRERHPAGRSVFLRSGARPQLEEIATFVIAHRDRRTEGLRWGFEPICRVLEVCPSTVRSHLARPPCARRVADEGLKIEIQRIFDVNYRVYGIRKIRARCGGKGSAWRRTGSPD